MAVFAQEMRQSNACRHASGYMANLLLEDITKNREAVFFCIMAVYVTKYTRY